MIRKLQNKDFSYMCEWMKDENITKNLQADFANFTEEKVKNFINSANAQNIKSKDIHFAIVNDEDEYMGTISLKNINMKDKNAEYAIVTRNKAHGKGYAKQATNDILKYGFSEMGLEKIYLYVSINNIAANKFYRKCGFKEEGIFRKHLCINDELIDIIWYSMLKEEFIDKE